MQQGVDINGDAYTMTTTLWQQMTTSASLVGTGPTGLANIPLGILGGGAETTGWLGNSGALGDLQASWNLFGSSTGK